MKKSLTALLIPCLDAEQDLIKSLETVTYNRGRLDVVIIDDGSTQPINKENLEKYFPSFDFHILRNDTRHGIVEALNRGLLFIKDNLYSCEYVARLDAGDKCLNDRINVLEGYLEKNKDVHLVSSWVNFVDVNGVLEYVFKPIIFEDTIKKNIYLYNPFVHPAVMYKLNTVFELGLYPVNYPALEDYALFINMVKKYKVHIIPEVLLEYEISPYSISSKKRVQQSLSKIKLIWNNFYFGKEPIIGLLKNIALLVVSRQLSTKIKKTKQRI